jgi:hypothetical protein
VRKENTVANLRLSYTHADLPGFYPLHHFLANDRAGNNPDRIASISLPVLVFWSVIFKGEIGVNGITTAAMIWVTAALGMGIGAGYEWVSVIACLMILLMLFIFGFAENWIDKINQTRNYKIVTSFKNETMRRFEKDFEAHNLRYKRAREIKDGDIIAADSLSEDPKKITWHLSTGSCRIRRSVVLNIKKDPLYELPGRRTKRPACVRRTGPGILWSSEEILRRKTGQRWKRS